MTSRQVKHNRKRKEQGLCKLCDKEAAPSKRKGTNGKSAFCPAHAIKTREARRARDGYERRYKNAASYKLEAVT